MFSITITSTYFCIMYIILFNIMQISCEPYRMPLSGIREVTVTVSGSSDNIPNEGSKR